MDNLLESDDRVWNYKTKRYAKKKTSLGKRLLTEYDEVTHEDTLELLATNQGRLMMTSLLGDKLYIPKTSKKYTKIVGALVDILRFNYLRPLHYFILFIETHRYVNTINSDESAHFLGKADPRIYVKDFPEQKRYVVGLFDKDRKYPLTYEDIHLTEEELALFRHSDSKNKIFLEKYGEDSGTLFTMEGDWLDVPPEYLIELHGGGSGGNCTAFDLRWLNHTIAQQLNAAKNNMPYPNHPYNPFTRLLFNYKDLRHLKYLLDTFVNKDDDTFPFVVRYYLSHPEIWCVNDPEVCPKLMLIESLEKDLRYRKINISDSQENLMGEWVPKDTQVSWQELMLENYIDNPNPFLMGDF